jgi:DNA-binding NarL/FixJ family response regulator
VTDANKGKIRVVVVEDHAIVRDGIAYLLNSESDLTVVGTASNGKEALQLLARLYPAVEVVLMDLQMPELDGVDTIRQLRELYKELKIIILTTFDSDEYIFEGIKSGANGYLLKDVPKDELCRAIRVVNGGQALVQPNITTRLFSMLSGQSVPGKINPATTTGSSANVSTGVGEEAEIYLTDRELDVLKLLAKGERNKEIALRLGIAESTVKGYIAIIFQKFGVSDRTEAAMFAVQRGIIKLN